MASKHILIAEDELNMRLSLSLTLKKAGYSISQAKDGYEALKIIKDSRNGASVVDLLLIDIQMPGLTGMELIAELERLNISLPVLVITGYGYKGTANGKQYKGCADFIEKPFSAEDLLEQVNHFFKEN